MNATALPTSLPLRPRPKASSRPWNGMKPDDRVDRDLDDLLGVLGRHLLDLDAALGRGHEGDARGGAVEHGAEIELAGDVAAVLDVDALDDPALRPGLVGDQRHAEHVVGELAHLLDRAWRA